MSENKTHGEIIEEMRFHGQLNIDAEKDKPEFGILTAEGRITLNYAAELEAAHKREIDSLTALIERLCEGLDNVYEREGIDYGSGEAYDDAKKYLAGRLENTQAEGGVAK